VSVLFSACGKASVKGDLEGVQRLPPAIGPPLLYRMCGDRTPLHSDPEFAATAGFPGPILHGLCTYGMTCKAMVDNLLDGDTARVGSYGARFAGVVYPGETLKARIWRDGDSFQSDRHNARSRQRASAVGRRDGAGVAKRDAVCRAASYATSGYSSGPAARQAGWTFTSNVPRYGSVMLNRNR
jgi:acyl dehydratase